MKIDKTEIAPSGKSRLKIYLGDEELEIINCLIQQGLRYTPRTFDNQRTVQHLRNMAKEMKYYAKQNDFPFILSKTKTKI